MKRNIFVVIVLVLLVAFYSEKFFVLYSQEYSRFGVVVWPNEITCDYIEELNAKTTFYTIMWGDVEPAQNKWRWESVDRALANAEACGLQLYIKLCTGYLPWATKSPIKKLKGQNPSCPPRNMEDYYDFVYTTVKYLKGKVWYFAIENEVNLAGAWQGTVKEYKELLKTAYKAVHDANPEAKVLDSGMSSLSYGPVIAREKYEKGKVHEAIDFYNHYFSHRGYSREDPSGVFVKNENELVQIIYNENNIRNYEYIKENLKFPFYDIYQLHFYEEWDLLPELLKWIKSKMQSNGYLKPIQAWEIGYAWTRNNYDIIDHALDTVKVIATAFGEGVEQIIYLPLLSLRAYFGYPEVWRGLYTPNLEPRPSAFNYKIISSKINNFSKVENLSFDNNTFIYKFTNRNRPIYICWSKNPSTINLEVNSKKVIITYSTTNSEQTEPIIEIKDTVKGKIILNLNKIPIFIEVQKMAKKRK
ncbi:hypothetical protein NLC26_01555 [Candidatus Aminicenantes bacterium AC-708-M15]|jgi:hypothetical protein|nr:hypothetical protein [SCandidatus Aminicenantes bacterium Aminicenantia_JdfR_composite]MCP2597197.1 hypothetical protein [Candidatus Aminicenantes bacterium AC-335-G13]MCP2598386.1 hypothetical protein [Candidatus Aminicenantes bacterium AC-335-L06]MCP2604147.1 hypothetical protein [Candidatus Aminicenantes bacterium AC-708-M15]MCP2617946.1 hypothetical protein [Candidatus Aminicenantes bacterium AC-335-A11]